MSARSRLRWRARRATRSAFDLAIASAALAVFHCGIASLLYGAVAGSFALAAWDAHQRAAALRMRAA